MRLGDFEIDLVSGELRRSDDAERILLREQPFQVLRLLIERGEKILTREEIKRTLWPNDTVVDFGHSINVAVGTLRRALGDSADNPRYIDTLARRGYRLLSPVEWLAPAGPHRPPARTKPEPGAHGLLGQQVSQYRVLEIIGSGGMGLVYKAEDLRLGRYVALKFLPDDLIEDPRALRRFEREARMMSTLNHANICTIYGIDQFEGQPFIVMELLEGETVFDRLKRLGGAMPLPSALDVSIQACEGLRAAHERGVIHRDIKPGNIFLTAHGHVKILDFGLARPEGSEEVPPESPQRSGEVTPGGATPGGSSAAPPLTSVEVGTAGYMSPEQAKGEKLDVRTDLYSLGLVLYEMATGVRAPQGDTVEAAREAQRQLRAAAPRALDVVLRRALEKDRERRYQSAAEMQSDLVRISRSIRANGHHIRTALAASALLVALVAGILYYGESRVALSPNDTVVLASVTNRTSDPIFDDALEAALRPAFEQTPYLNLLRADKIAGALAQLKLPPTARLTPEVGVQVCRKTGSKMVLAGSIADAGNRFALELRALDGGSGSVIAQVHQTVGERSEIVHALGILTARLRRKVGEPAASIARFNQPLEVATSSSLEALQAAIAGRKRQLSSDLTGAIGYYRQALALDPEFATVHEALGTALLYAGDLASGLAAETRAYQLRSRMSEPYRSYAEYLYQIYVERDDDRALASAEDLVNRFPNDALARNNLGFVLAHMGQLIRSGEQYRESARIEPSGYHCGVAAVISLRAGQTDEAKWVLRGADARGFDGVELRYAKVLLALVEDDPATLGAQWRWSSRAPPGAGLEDLHSLVETYHGRFRRADALWTRAGLSESGPNMARREAEAGNAPRANQIASESSAPSDPQLQLAMALALARAGNLARAGKITDSIATRYPGKDETQRYLIPTVRAAICLGSNNPARALALLGPTARYELALCGGFNAIYPAYLRGLAYLQLGQGDRAENEFQRLVTHRGVVVDDVLGALVYVQLGRGQRMSGRLGEAARSYETFLALWKDADPDIPIYRAAKKEYADLLRRVSRQGGNAS